MLLSWKEFAEYPIMDLLQEHQHLHHPLFFVWHNTMPISQYQPIRTITLNPVQSKRTRCWFICNQFLRRPIVCISNFLSGTLGYSCPSGPKKKLFILAILSASLMLFAGMAYASRKSFLFFTIHKQSLVMTTNKFDSFSANFGYM